MKPYPLHKACKYFDYCTSKEGKNRKDCGDCPLHPRASRVFTPMFVISLIAQILFSFFIGAVLTALFFLAKGL